MKNGEYPISPIIKDFSDYVNYGLTKREYYAGLAMQGIIGKQGTSTWKPKDFAVFAVDMADELLKQLNNG